MVRIGVIYTVCMNNYFPKYNYFNMLLKDNFIANTTLLDVFTFAWYYFRRLKLAQFKLAHPQCDIFAQF